MIKAGITLITEQVEFFETSEDAYQREGEIVTLTLLEDPLCLNLTTGGLGRGARFTHSTKTKEKMSEKQRGVKNPMFGKTHNADALSKMRGRVVSEETKELQRQAMLGKTHTIETKIKLSNIAKGKTLSKEHINIIRETHKGKTVSNEVRRKSAQTQSIGYWVTPKGTFLNVKEAANANKCDRGTLRRRCKQLGKRPSPGYYFVNKEGT